MSIYLDQYQNIHTDWLPAGLQGIYGNRWIGQTFKAGMDGNLAEVRLWMYKTGNPNDLIVEIQGVDGFGNPNGVTLASTTVLASSVTTDVNGAEIIATFSTPTSVSSGTNYAIVVHTTGGDSSNCYDHYGKNVTNPYSNGLACYSADGGSNWTQKTNNDLYFKTYVGTVSVTDWYDISADIRVLKSQLDDIIGDIRVVSIKESIRDVNTDIRSAKRLFYDTNCDIRVVEDYDREYDIPLDIRVMDSPFRDINCDIRTTQEGGEFAGFLPDIDCDIRVMSRYGYNINTDIRVQEDKSKIYDINCDIRVIPTPAPEIPSPPPGQAKLSPEAIGLDGFKVYLDGTEIEDVDRDTINWEWTLNESPGSATFRVARKSDNYNKTLENLSQAINTNTPIEIKFNNKLRYYGYVISLNVEQSGEAVVVNCLDRKHRIQNKLYDISFGRKWEFPEQGQLNVVEGTYLTTGLAITGLLDSLVSDGLISSYSGVPDGIIVEYQETQGMPAGTLLTELLDLTGNFYWNITPQGKLEIYEGGAGSIKYLPIQQEGKQIHLYDVINFNLNLNDRSNLITTVEVTMGTESEEERASYRNVGVGALYPAWTTVRKFFDELSYSYHYATSWLTPIAETLRRIQIFKRNHPDKAKEIGTKWRIGNWTDGSFIDTNFKSKVLIWKEADWIIPSVLWREAGWEEINGWSWGGKYLNLAHPYVKLKRFTSYVSPDPLNPKWFVHFEHEIKHPKLIGRFYRKESVSVAEKPSIFDVVWIGIGGEGAKRKVTFSQLGIRDSIGWTAFEENKLVAKSEPGYDDTEYATDRAKLILSRINDPITEGTVSLTFDAFDYYNLNIGNRINLTGTNENNIYNGNNGFPLDIQSISFNAGSYIINLNVNHIRNFKATKNYR